MSFIQFIVSSFDSFVYLWYGGTITHFIFETSTLHRHISTFISPNYPSHYTTLVNFYHNLERLHHYLSNNYLHITNSSHLQNILQITDKSKL